MRPRQACPRPRACAVPFITYPPLQGFLPSFPVIGGPPDPAVPYRMFDLIPFPAFTTASVFMVDANGTTRVLVAQGQQQGVGLGVVDDGVAVGPVVGGLQGRRSPTTPPFGPTSATIAANQLIPALTRDAKARRNG